MATVIGLQSGIGNRLTRQLMDRAVVAIDRAPVASIGDRALAGYLAGHGGRSERASSVATVARAPLIQRPLPRGPMSMQSVRRLFRERFGISRVESGTLAAQAASLNRLAGPPVQGATRPGDLLERLVDSGTLSWAPWEPGDGSAVYAGIARGLEDFARAMGGIPPVEAIVFYAVDYEATTAPPGLAENPGTAATYSGGVLHVFKSSSTNPTRVPVERDQPGRPGRRSQLTTAEGLAGFTSHELGHGLQEVALTPPRPDATLMADYRRAVGWVGSRLFDVGDPALSAELTAGRVPRRAQAITRSNWASGGWTEQPMSAYMTTSAFEDFPEAVRAFVTMPDVLRSRSPHRFQFLAARRGILGSHLRPVSLPPPIGDFPIPSGDSAYA